MPSYEVNVLRRVAALKQVFLSSASHTKSAIRFSDSIQQKGLETIVFMAADLYVEIDLHAYQPNHSSQQTSQSLPTLRPVAAAAQCSLQKDCPIRQLSALNSNGLQEYHIISQDKVRAAALRMIIEFAGILVAQNDGDRCLCGNCGEASGLTKPKDLLPTGTGNGTAHNNGSGI